VTPAPEKTDYVSSLEEINAYTGVMFHQALSGACIQRSGQELGISVAFRPRATHTGQHKSATTTIVLT
jgi:hypothetical protein